MASYLAVGPPGNLEIGINEKVWGMLPTRKSSWQRLVAGDRVIFYATAPVKGVVGYALIESTMSDDSLLWPEEKQKAQVQWPLRIRLGSLRVLPAAEWRSRRVEIDRKGLSLQRSFQRLEGERVIKLVQGIDAELNKP